MYMYILVVFHHAMSREPTPCTIDRQFSCNLHMFHNLLCCLSWAKTEVSQRMGQLGYAAVLFGVGRRILMLIIGLEMWAVYSATLSWYFIYCTATNISANLGIMQSWAPCNWIPCCWYLVKLHWTCRFVSFHSWEHVHSHAILSMSVRTCTCIISFERWPYPYCFPVSSQQRLL